MERNLGFVVRFCGFFFWGGGAKVGSNGEMGCIASEKRKENQMQRVNP